MNFQKMLFIGKKIFKNHFRKLIFWKKLQIFSNFNFATPINISFELKNLIYFHIFKKFALYCEKLKFFSKTINQTNSKWKPNSILIRRSFKRTSQKTSPLNGFKKVSFFFFSLIISSRNRTIEISEQKPL